MGGSAGKAIKGAVSDAAGVTTAGIVDVKNGKINLDPTKAGKNFVESATGAGTMKGMMPDIPKPPGAQDPAAAEAKARAVAEKKAAEELGMKSKGFSSTILGGSTSQDDSILKKKTLLGE